MSHDAFSERPLFGGAISMTFPNRFQDLSNLRQVPDHQEAFADANRDESIIVELLDLKHDVADETSAVWFLQDLATEQDAEGGMVIEQSGVLEVPGLCYRGTPAVITSAVGQMAISKGRQGREAQNIVRVYLANLRLKEVGTDVLITAYEPVVINPLSESAGTVGAGVVRSAQQSGCTPMAEVFKVSVSSFKTHSTSFRQHLNFSMPWSGLHTAKSDSRFLIPLRVLLSRYPCFLGRNHLSGYVVTANSSDYPFASGALRRGKWLVREFDTILMNRKHILDEVVKRCCIGLSS